MFRLSRLAAGTSLVTALALAASALTAAVLSPAVAAQTARDIEVRDQLIADQENLLNTYRCLFGVDTDVVPGGCPDPDEVSPGVAPGNPTQQDVDVRDGLIQSQEALLNVYRCQFDVDTQLVPGGCTGQGQPGQGEPDQGEPGQGEPGQGEPGQGEPGQGEPGQGEPGQGESGQGGILAGQYSAVGVGDSYSCAIAADSSIACWGYNAADRADPPTGQYTAIATGLYHSCAIRADQTIACWDWPTNLPEGVAWAA